MHLQIDDNATEEQELGAEEIMLSAQEMQAQLDSFAQNEEMDTIDTTAGETVAELDPELAEILEKSEQEPEPQEPEENENEEEDGDLDSLFEPPNTPEAIDSSEPPHVEESPQSPEPGNEQASSNPQAPADDPEDALDSDEIGSLIDQAFAEDTQIIPAPSKASPRPEDLAPDQATQEPASTNASPTNNASIQEVDIEPRDEANDIVEKEINAEARITQIIPTPRPMTHHKNQLL
jgi:hypothetical protein